MAVKAFVGTQGADQKDGTFGSKAYGASDPLASSNTVVTNLTTAFTDLDTAAAAIIAITGDTYSTVTHQFTFGGATGLTHAQWATNGALLNTAFADFVTAQTAAVAAKATLTGNVTLLVDTAVVTTMNGLKSVLRSILTAAAGCGLFTA